MPKLKTLATICQWRLARGIGNGLSFKSPQAWSGSETSALTGRWQPVTVPCLQKAGAKFFAWINPGESLTDKGAVSWKPCQHGAFVYLFHGLDSREDGLFFEVDEIVESSINDSLQIGSPALQTWIRERGCLHYNIMEIEKG